MRPRRRRRKQTVNTAIYFDKSQLIDKRLSLPLHNLLFSATRFKVSLNHYISI